MTIDRAELGWAAGVLDGEGCVDTVLHSGNGTVAQIRLRVSQAHPAIPWRFWLAVGKLGYVYGPYNRRRNIGTTPDTIIQMWEFRSQSFYEVQAIVAMLWFKLCRPRKNQAVEALTVMHEYYVRIGKMKVQSA